MRDRQRIGHDGKASVKPDKKSAPLRRGGLAGALLDLQRGAGNTTTSALVVQAKLIVGHDSDPLEHEADRVADGALATLRGGGPVAEAGGDAPGDRPASVRRMATGAADVLGGRPVDPAVESAIEAARRGGGRPVAGNVAAAVGRVAGADLSRVRVHDDGHADQLSRSLQAKAFTTGSDIFFQRGAYDPSSPAGRETLAHELAHVVQQGGTASRDTAIHRRIDPSTAVIFEGMASKATGKDAKGFLFFTTPTYKKVKSGLNDYIKQQDTKPAKWKLDKLRSIDKYIAEWLADKKHAKATTEDANNRREAMQWLVPRVQAEVMMLSNIGAKQQQDAPSGGSDKGGMNTVELGVKTKKNIGFSKGNTGVFKAPASSYTGGQAPAALDAGIDRSNPKFIERAVASSAVAKLMGSDVVAETVKAERGGKTGYLMEQVSGVQPRGEGKIRPANDIERAAWAERAEWDTDNFESDEKGPYKKTVIVNEINWQDPELQEQLVELQLLDTITGQVDRHASNYFVEQGPGKATKVKGIDPDLSFGKDKGIEQVRGPMSVNDKSMAELPPICTRSVAKRILAMTERDLKQLLGGTLDREEVAAAVKRLSGVQAHIQDLDRAGCVFESFREEDDNYRTARFTDKNSYIARDMYWQARTALSQKK